MIGPALRSINLEFGQELTNEKPVVFPQQLSTFLILLTFMIVMAERLVSQRQVVENKSKLQMALWNRGAIT